MNFPRQPWFWTFKGVVKSTFFSWVDPLKTRNKMK